MDLLINATPLGLKAGDPLPLDEKQFSLRQARAVYDMIYKPAETKLLAAAKAAGCKTANGLGMLLHQGAKAFEIWTGKPAPLDVMRRALEQNVYSTMIQSQDGRKPGPLKLEDGPGVPTSSRRVAVFGLGNYPAGRQRSRIGHVSWDLIYGH